MKSITQEMVRVFEMKKLGYDFMGYTFVDCDSQLSFHHLIVPKRNCKKEGLGDGYLFWNGAILRQDTSHEYLHTIERVDREIFLQITKEMVDENNKRKIDIENLKRIRELLLYFEEKYKDIENKQGKKLIKQKYITQRINFDKK